MEKPSLEERIQKSLDRLRLPIKGAVACWDVEVGTDSTGDAAVWVYVIVHDRHVGSLMAREDDWEAMRESIRGKVADIAGLDVLTYVRLRALSEVAPKLAAAR